MIGAPAGYVGYEEGGNFTELIRHRPYSVILLDEIEKAHPEVFNILLQVLDNGQLTDAKGRRVNFRNTVIIMTSNLGANYIDKMEKFGFGTITDGPADAHATERADYEQIKNRVMESLREFFRPEFLNRIDDTIIFDILNRQAIRQIVEIQVGLVKDRLAAKEITLDVVPEVYEYLAKEGYNPQYGARPLKRLIQNKILTPVASLMISKGIMRGGTVKVYLKTSTVKNSAGVVSTVTDFGFEVKKGKKGSLLREDLLSVGNSFVSSGEAVN